MGLTCDSTANPRGVDDPQPRFHWSLKARDKQLRNIQQTAFQILVDSSRAKLDRDSADVWDSNKTSASIAPSVAYAGPPLISDTVYHWKVRVWDQRGRPSTWSATRLSSPVSCNLPIGTRIGSPPIQMALASHTLEAMRAV